MKKLLGALAIVILSTRLLAQSNEPIRLALITETNEASTASDVLTAQLSGNPELHLLERDEIEKVYREQGLSAANKDYLKLGRILGADGLLLFDVVRTPQTTNLMTRLIAVKPGVILTDGSFPWPLKDTPSWAESVATHLNAFLPKLALLPKDAIPISVVNLRSAVQSADGQEAERQLKLLAIQRLSQERQFFVLERQQMQLLSEEKELKVDESAFWNGSYLLEGVVDQNGYSKETITINARLTPPKGGAPLLMEVSGNRTNLSEVINHLAEKVVELLKVHSSVPEWNAADEAAQYFNEAKWALRWGVFSEAEAAADSAWALGKRDLDCALVRVKAYMSEVSAMAGGYQNTESGVQSGYEANGVLVGRNPPDSEVQSMIKYLLAEHPYGMVYKITKRPGAQDLNFVFADKPPDSQNIDRALHALELYYEFSRTSPEGEPKILWRGAGWNDWHDADWYRLGIDDLVAASRILQNFNFVPESQKPVAEKLAELRALTRSVAEWISKSPSVHDSYFVGDRIAERDELGHTIEESPNIFRCKVNWGCYWQEKPEDGVALYRDLMSSPVFSYIHTDFWLRNLQTPRLVAWNENDRQRISMVWDDFVRELEVSTNVLLQLEAKALALADADNDKKVAATFTNFFNSVFENREALVANRVEVLNLNWGADALVRAKTSGGIVTNTKESLQHLFYSEYRPKLEAMDKEYWDKINPVLTEQTLSKLGVQSPYPGEKAFEQQKQYLKENKPYDFFEFAKLFTSREFSKTQALEIQPLVAAYKSNLVAQSQNASGRQKGQLMGAIAQVGFLEDGVNRTLHPPSPRLQQQAQAQAPKPASVAKAAVVDAISTNAPGIVTNVISVGKFLAIPAERLVDLNSSERVEYLQLTITAHHWFEERLLLDYDYYAGIQWLDGKGKVMGGRNVGGPAIAILDPTTAHWEVIGCPKVEIQAKNNFYHRSTLLHNELFTSDGGQIQKYDFQNQQWRVLAVSDGNNYELFAVNEHLYAASKDLIFEILDGGKATRILASARRNPPASALDREDLGTPTLFEGPNHSLRVCTASKIFTWTGDNWHEDSTAPSASFRPEIIPDGLVFRNADSSWPDQISSLSYLATETNTPELCLWQKISLQKNPPSFGYRPGAKASPPPEPLWKMPLDVSLTHLPAALCESGLYLLMNHSEKQEIANDQHVVVQEKVVAKDGCNAVLLCFFRGLLLPQRLFLKFDAPDGCPPAAGIDPNPHGGFPTLPPAWMLATTNILFLGLERPRNSIPAFNQADRIGIGYKAGVWLLLLSQIEPDIAAQKQIQLQLKSKDEAAAKNDKTQ